MKKAKKIILIVIVLLFVAALAAGYFITAYQMNKNFGRGEYPDKRFTATYLYDHYENDYPRQEVSFRSGDNTLKGFVYGADNNKGLIVFAHGIGSGHELYLGLITGLVDRGWRVFAYDATGSGYSEGEGTMGLAQSVIDLDKALSYVESSSELNSLDTFVLGHSWGGYASAAILNFDHDIKACFSMSGYNTPFEKLAESCDGMFGKASFLLYPFVWTYNKVKFGKDSSWSAVEGINKKDTPVYIVHGSDDSVILFDGASVIAHKDEITNPNVEYKVFSDKDRNGHSSYFNSVECREYINEVCMPAQEALFEKYDNNVPDEEIEKFIDSVDGDLYNEFDPDVIQLVDDFFSKQLG